MKTKIQYITQEERSQIIIDNENLILIEEQNYLNEESYLIFSDVPLEKEIVYKEVPQVEFENVKSDVVNVNQAIMGIMSLLMPPM